MFAIPHGPWPWSRGRRPLCVDSTEPGRGEAVARARPGPAVTSGPPRRRRTRPADRNGQSLAEFALVVPLLLALVGAIIQFGLIFWAQNTLTQVVRDTGRWAATQTASPCSSAATAGAVNGQANLIAANSSLLGYTTNEWTGPTLATSDTGVAAFTSSVSSDAVVVAWVKDSDPGNEGCLPKDNQAAYHVTIRVNHAVPVFFPGMQYLPGLGSCDSSGCHIVLSSTAQFRMEPKP